MGVDTSGNTSTTVCTVAPTLPEPAAPTADRPPTGE